MSNLNLEWLARNLPADATILDIGCANMSDTVNMKRYIPNGQFHAFECAESWKAWNESEAIKHSINYYHMAVSDTIGELTFYPSGSLDGQEWPWSGSVCEPGPNLLNERWTWNQGYTVPSTTLEAFCIEHNVNPDFIHIDVQGAEYKVFSKLGVIRPLLIWAEVSEFHMYKTGTTLEGFQGLMQSLGYKEIFRDSCDALFVLQSSGITEYEQKS
jgi:FkbM family methyltransferase